MKEKPRRFVDARELEEARPVHVVWEITLACNLHCQHCGSRAGSKRASELSFEECRSIIDELKSLGTREITLIGGEAYLRKDWIEIIRCIRDHNIDCSLQTGGRGLTPERLKAAVMAGLQGCGLSIDGTAELHDRLRGVPGSFIGALKVLEAAKELNVVTSVNTQIGPSTPDLLPSLMEILIDKGVRNWQLQVTVAMGRAADNPELLLQPFEMQFLLPLIFDLSVEAERHGLNIQVGNNIGYFGPHERRWRRGVADRGHWIGCTAGTSTLGLEADGTVKGCPSLPTSDYAGGNVRSTALSQIWNESNALSINRSSVSAHLWGLCATCYYGPVCGGGCTWTAHSLFGRGGNNPYCYYRASQLAKIGLQETIHRIKQAPGKPFDYGEFSLVVVDLAGNPVSAQDVPPQIGPSPPTETSARAALVCCKKCDCFFWPQEKACPHCGDVDSAKQARAIMVAQNAQKILNQLQQ